MKKGMWAGLALAMMLSVAGVASAASNDVVVVFNDQTEVNRETYKFMMRNFGELNLGVTLKAAQDPSTVKAGAQKAVVVLNTGLTTGTDPVLKAFIDKYANKKELFIVNLIAGSDKLTIQKFPAASAPLGVDTVTAASIWSEGDDKMTYIKLHQEWIKVLGEFVKSR